MFITLSLFSLTSLLLGDWLATVHTGLVPCEVSFSTNFLESILYRTLFACPLSHFTPSFVTSADISLAVDGPPVLKTLVTKVKDMEKGLERDK